MRTERKQVMFSSDLSYEKNVHQLWLVSPLQGWYPTPSLIGEIQGPFSKCSCNERTHFP